MRHAAERISVSHILRQATIGPARPFVVQKGRNMVRNLPLRLARVLLIAAAAASLTGCGVVAFPVRTTSAAVKIVPVAGDVVAYPLDKTADAID
jgi:hypothetical protein